MDIQNLDQKWMAQAIDLSRRGYPASNPHVGCVIVREGELVGEGWHEAAGLDHAEAMALKNAGELARGATAYVTLEPCNHHGRTGPCSHALLQAGVARVVYAIADPNKTASGGGAFLAEHGVEVVSGVLQENAGAANSLFLDAMARQKAKVVLKAAMTADGFSARTDGTSKWITGPEARERGHELRAELGVVIVGKGTVIADDPALTARLPRVINQPIPYVIDSKRSIEGPYQLLKNPSQRFITSSDVSGPGDIGLPRNPEGHLDLERLPQRLFEHGHIGALIEGGPHTLNQFLTQGVWDELWMFRATTEFGAGMPWAMGLRIEELDAELVSEERCGADTLFVYRHRRCG